MGEECGSWFSQQKLHCRSQNFIHLGAALDLGQKSILSSYTKASTDMVSTNGTLSACPFPELSQAQCVQANEPHAWFYCLPCFRQEAYAPALNSLLKEKLPTLVDDHQKEVAPLKQESEHARKRFLVFDQSGDQTTLILSSGVRNPARCFPSWNPKEQGSYILNNQANENRENLNHNTRPITTNDIGDNIRNDTESELHEDTEELNALLYSEDDYGNYTVDDDDEVSSAAQSPSTMTVHDKPYWKNENAEEVASSDGSTRKRKLVDKGCTDRPFLMNRANSSAPLRGLECEDDAESRCNDNVYAKSAELVSEPSNKRMRVDRIRETVSILQNIIPNGKGKDAMLVLDEAILYLKSLKHMAKSLELDDAP